MSEFFSDTRFFEFPISRIRRIGGITKKNVGDHGTISYHSVELDDDLIVQVSQSVVSDILERPLSLVVAEPGTYMLHAGDEPGGKYWKSKIIAWALCADALVRPVTADGINDGLYRHDPTILHPDGSVAVPGDCDYETVDDWLKAIWPASTTTETGNA